MQTKREDELRAAALDMALRMADRSETASGITDRAGTFLSFLRGNGSERPKRGTKRTR